MSKRGAVAAIAEHRVSILLAIIGFAGAVTPILVTSLSGLVSNTPIVNIDFALHRNNNREEAEVTLTNVGFGLDPLLILR